MPETTTACCRRCLGYPACAVANVDKPCHASLDECRGRRLERHGCPARACADFRPGRDCPGQGKLVDEDGEEW